jgi:hypothetical protein
MNEDDYYTHVPLDVVGSLRAITPERLAQLLKAEADLAAAREQLAIAKADRNTYDSAHKNEAAAHLRTLADLAAARALLREVRPHMAEDTYLRWLSRYEALTGKDAK